MRKPEVAQAHSKTALADIASSPSGPRAHSDSLPSSSAWPSSLKPRSTNSGRHAAEIEAREAAAAAMLQRKLLQQRRRQRAMHHQVRIAFLAACIGLVVVNAMAVEGQRRIAKQQRRIGLEVAAPLRNGLMALPVLCGCARPGGAASR